MNYPDEFEKIHRACSALFGKNIDISPRALQALISARRKYELFGAEVSFASDFECFLQVVASSPACADALIREGVPLQTWVDAASPIIDPKKHLDFRDYSAMFANIFKAKWPLLGNFQDVGLKVSTTGKMTETDIFIGCLQVGRTSLTSNDTAKHLLRAADLFDDSLVDERGDEYLNKLEVQCGPIVSVDESHAEQQLLLYADEHGRFRIQAFGANTVGLLEDNASRNGPFTFRGGVIQHHPTALLYAPHILEELEDLINSHRVKESDFQRFFERHPHFLSGLDYKKVHAQPILYKDDGGKLIPDFFLEQIDSGWHAIADLKLPYDQMVIRRKNRVYFAQWIQEAIAQLQFYKEWFDSRSNRVNFEEQQGISTRVFRPKMILIAGRSNHFIDDIERIRLLTNQDRDLMIWTYDDVVSRVKRYHSFVHGRMLESK